MDYKNLNIRVITSVILLILLLLFFTKLENHFIYFIRLSYIIILLEILFFFNKKIRILFFSIFYVIISFYCFEIYYKYYLIKNIFISYILIIILFDTFSYLIGSLYGSKKILPKISPNKTYFGFFGGIFLTYTVMIVLNFLFFSINFHMIIFFITIIILSSFFGDLFESYLKRKSNIKNSGFILPGHGGFFDRFDSFLMSTITLLFYSHFIL